MTRKEVIYMAENLTQEEAALKELGSGSVTKLKMTFYKENGDTMDISYNYANPEVTSENVKTLMAALITNGDIFEDAPVSIGSAKLITTTETAIDLS